jgi:hypothetical protein
MACTALVVLVPSTAVGAPDTTVNFQFRGRAGDAVLTDCPVGAPVGTECRAVSVFAFENRVNDDGQQSSGAGMDVTLFDVIITGEGEGFVAIPVGFGITDFATVRIDANLRSGTASAVDIPLCEMFECEAGAVESVSVDVQWVGTGPISKDKDHSKSLGPCSFNEHFKGTLRSAEATGVINGDVFVEPQIPGFDATLQTDKFLSVVRCQL